MSDADPILVIVNGEPRQVPAGSTVLELLTSLGLGGKQVAVERNKAIVRRADHAATVLAADDRLEIVTFFGGG